MFSRRALASKAPEKIRGASSWQRFAVAGCRVCRAGALITCKWYPIVHVTGDPPPKPNNDQQKMKETPPKPNKRQQKWRGSNKVSAKS